MVIGHNFNMQEDDTLNNVWYFWNHNFYNRTKPSRKIEVRRRHSPDYEVVCHYCKIKIPLRDSIRRKVIFDGSRDKDSAFMCKICYKIRRENLMKQKEKELVYHREEKVKEFLDSIEKFDDLMADCEYNTCDILAAHHELLINDDNRLRTDFMLELICGQEKKKKYLESRK